MGFGLTFESHKSTIDIRFLSHAFSGWPPGSVCVSLFYWALQNLNVAALPEVIPAASTLRPFSSWAFWALVSENERKRHSLVSHVCATHLYWMYSDCVFFCFVSSARGKVLCKQRPSRWIVEAICLAGSGRVSLFTVRRHIRAGAR